MAEKHAETDAEDAVTGPAITDRCIHRLCWVLEHVATCLMSGTVAVYPLAHRCSITVRIGMAINAQLPQSRARFRCAIKSCICGNRAFVKKLLDDVWIAEAVHQDDADAMAGMCALERRHILQFDGEADHFQTAFAIALWPEQKEVGPTRQRGEVE